ncbi:MAG: hypothetical protein K6F75_13115 [Butyrivibrio sp.]|nr:hypothetical protein [Butyrivibrio sp.]
MKKRKSIVPVLLCVAALMTACGEEKAAETPSMFEEVGTETQGQQADQPEQNAVQTENADANTDAITEDQAYVAVINYNEAIGSGIDGEINSEGYTEYWDVSTNEDNKIVVLYRSYTGAQIRYYVDPISGETYVTELVPGIIDEEQENGEKFNARDYLTAEQSDEKTAEASSSVPVENETADGFMGSFLLASDKDKIDTTNEYGVLYRVIYDASLEGDELIACGSMDYRNFKDQDPITISSDVKHVFKVDGNTVYQKEGEEGTETLSKEDFAGLLDSRKDSGMYFGIEISGGVVKTVTLAAQ